MSIGVRPRISDRSWGTQQALEQVPCPSIRGAGKQYGFLQLDPDRLKPAKTSQIQSKDLIP